MPETSRKRLLGVRQRLAIPRDQYLDAVKRQEDRAWAKWTDPTRSNEFRPKLLEQNKKLGITSKLPPPRKPHLALFDPDDYILRDDAIIKAYLSDHPNETRRPYARGRTHDELLEFWKSSREGRRHVEQDELQIKRTIENLKSKYLGDGQATE